MTRLPRFIPSLALACIFAGPAIPVFAQQAQPAAPDAAAAPAEPVIDSALKKNVEDFWYYASIGRYDLAKAEGDKITASDKPEQVFLAFQAVVQDRNRFLPQDRHIELFDRVLSWQRVPELKDTAVKILEMFKKAQHTRSTDTAFIEEQVKRLGGNYRAYSIAVQNLRVSGELAVPVMLRYLRDPQFKELHVPIRNALRDMERRGLAPLLAATEMKDWDTLTWIIGVLGDLRYNAAIPYLARVYQAKDTPPPVKDAALRALTALEVNEPQSLNAAQLFYEQGEQYYYDKGAVRPPSGDPTALLWSWSGDTLSAKPVPIQTYHDDVALKCLEACLKLDPARGDAVSLWIDAGFQREAELPEGATDGFWGADHPATAFYATSAGTKHLNPALSRALRDRNTPVSLKAIKSLQDIAGSANLFTGEEDRPLIDAMKYPDRQVRFEAAFAVAGSLPTRQFLSQERVVPILAEALAQSGKAGILVLAPSQDDVNKITGAVAGNPAYVAKGGASPDAAIAAMAALPGVDVIILEAGDKNIDQMIQGINDQPRLERAARLILVGEGSQVTSPWASVAATNPLYTVTKAKPDDAKGLADAIEQARKRSGNVPLDEKLATAYSLRAAELLGKLALTRDQVLDLAPAQAALLAGLEDARPEIVKASGAALAYLNSREAQTGLIVKGMDEKTPDDLKIATLDDLATNARAFGNQLDPALIQDLLKLMQGSAPNEVKAAASRAYGALNLNSDQVKSLILNQSGK